MHSFCYHFVNYVDIKDLPPGSGFQNWEPVPHMVV